MVTKETRKSGTRKLNVKKETIKNLDVKHKADNVKGGQKQRPGKTYTCTDMCPTAFCF